MKRTLPLSALPLLLAPLGAFAGTYTYTDNNHTTVVVSADTEAEARAAIAGRPGLMLLGGSDANMNIATDTTSIASSSNSMMTPDTTGAVGGSGNAGDLTTGTAAQATYDYVDISQIVRTVQANSPMEAIAIAPDIDPKSGVIVHSGAVIPGESVTNQ